MSCQPIVWPPCPVPECPEQIVYASQNGNLNGVGVLDSNTASLGTFRGVNGDGQYISTTLDAANLSITVALIAAAIPAAIPQATETVAGKGEVATQAETNAGVSDTTFVTPLKLQTRQATTTMFGLGRLGTQAEINVGTVADALVTSLTLGTRLLTVKTTRVFGNAAVRAAVAPDFDGQLGTQLDTDQVYVATGLAAGNWQQSWMGINTSNTLTATTAINTTVGNDFWVGVGGLPFFTVASTGVTFNLGADIASPGTLDVQGGARLNFATTALLQVNGTSVPANSVVITSGTLGQVSSKVIADFISTSNTQTGWGTPTGTLDRATFDASTVTLPELGERVAALITDLKLKLLPAT